jgi:hypothetical protein
MEMDPSKERKKARRHHLIFLENSNEIPLACFFLKIPMRFPLPDF